MSNCSNCGLTVTEEARNEDLNFLALIRGWQVPVCKRCAPAIFPFEKKVKWEKKPNVPTMGVEVECNPSIKFLAKVARDNICSIGVDNSLRGCSAEIIVPPTETSRFASVIHSTFDGAEAQTYRRCGNHYWLSSRHMSWSELNAFMYACAYWEPSFAELTTNHRYPGANDPSGKPQSIRASWKMRQYPTKDSWLYSIYGECGGTLRRYGERRSKMAMAKRANDHGDRSFPNGPVNRYWWMNIHGHYRFGAIEIRLHQASVIPFVILNTINSWAVWMSVYSKMSNCSKYSPLSVLPKNLERFWKEMISMIAKSNAASKRNPDLVEDKLF